MNRERYRGDLPPIGGGRLCHRLRRTHRWAVAQQNPEFEKELSAGLEHTRAGGAHYGRARHYIHRRRPAVLTPSLDRDWADPLVIPACRSLPTASSVLFATTSTSRSLAILMLTALRRPAC